MKKHDLLISVQKQLDRDLALRCRNLRANVRLLLSVLKAVNKRCVLEEHERNVVLRCFEAEKNGSAP